MICNEAFVQNIKTKDLSQHFYPRLTKWVVLLVKIFSLVFEHFLVR